jgi:acetylornithine/N-succinyldiaminopimelate aminotransferase
VAVNSLGHAHPHLVEALTEQARKVWHTSNLYRIPGGERLAQRLIDNTFAEKVFFCNSGAEALEASIKMARRYQYSKGRPERFRIITFEGAFHGRTLATIAAGGQPKYLEGFGPKVDGFDQVPFADDKALQAAIGPETAGILIEPIQGEGGYLVPPDGFLAGLRALCDRHGILLIFDEVQSGVGRSGRMFAGEHWGVRPDILTLAKGLGSGLPIGLVVAKKTIMEKWQRGAHGNTYGGNPLCCAAALATLELVESEYAANAARVGEYFMTRLRQLQQRHPVIGDVRGKGLMMGMELVTDRDSRKPAKALCDAVITRAFHQGLLLLSCGASTVRFMPPLMICNADVDEAVVMLEAALVEASA